MGSGSPKTGNSWLSYVLMGPAHGYFQKKLGMFQDRRAPPTKLTDVGDNPAAREMLRRRQGGARSTILSGVQGPSGGGNPVLGGS